MLILHSLYLLAALRAGSTTLSRSARDSNTQSPLNCGGHTFSCRNNEQCFPHQFTCDGYKDCRDGSDELHCPPLAPSDTPSDPSQCGAFEVKCGWGRNRTCVSYAKWCDGNDDCGNGADEGLCYHKSGGGLDLYCPQPLSTPQFVCSNSLQESRSDLRCIPLSLRCDGIGYCGDNSDERPEFCQKSNSSVEVERCPVGQFECNNTHQCIANEKRCDGHSDCTDNSDEYCDASGPTMAPHCDSLTEVPCRDRTCIRNIKWCDGVSDCSDGSDETASCNIRSTCSGNEMKCTARARCIGYFSWCDNHTNCGDGSDEANCPFVHLSEAACRSRGAFWCDGLCRNGDVRCDEKFDCHDRADEKDCPSPTVQPTVVITEAKTNGQQAEASDSSKTIAIAGGAAGGALLLIVIIAVIIVLQRSRAKKDDATIARNPVLIPNASRIAMVSEKEVHVETGTNGSAV